MATSLPGELFLCRHSRCGCAALAAQDWGSWLIGEPAFATRAR